MVARVLAELARAVRARRVASRELVALALARIERLDGGLGSVVALRAEEALAEAAALDERVAAGEDPGPLAGIPFLVKDVEDLSGMPTTWGSLLLEDAPPATRDGLVPRRLRSAGAIPIGKTNAPEFATEGFTSNLLFGTTRNPWAPEWSPGGSSGGSAAAVAAGLAPIGTATDGGGSIRIPSAFCGLVGIKPTNGVIPRDPIPPWIDLSTDGPLATAVEDLRLLLEIEAGPEPGDPTALLSWGPGPGGMPSRVIAAPRFTAWGPLPEPVRELFERALEDVERELGLPVEPIEPESIFRAGNPDTDWFVLCPTEHVALLGREIVERNLGRMHPTTQSFMREGLRTTIEEYLAARRRRFDYVRELDELLGQDAVIATPTLASEGWLAEGRMPGADELGVPAEVYNTAVQNITGHPAISLPAGRSPNGVPFGLQVTAPRFRDDLLLDLAEAWERARPWPRAAEGYEPFEL
jgi:Asp-tRNA(Asn)/Glu-tRNA(Gln) amidotransferase A subunit family amidase